MSTARITALRTELRARFPAAQPVEAPHGVLRTGVTALDGLLPHGGLPRGRVSEWVAARSGGSATLLRGLVRETLAVPEAVALVDAGRTLAAADWVEAAREGPLTTVRPADPGDGPWCAELLLRTGAFGLVVLDGVAVPAPLAPRLAHRVREAGCAFLIVRPDEGDWRANGHSGAALRVVLAPATAPALRAPANDGPRQIRATLVKGGPEGQVELRCVEFAPHRLCAHPLVPDRRGGARRGRSW